MGCLILPVDWSPLSINVQVNHAHSYLIFPYPTHIERPIYPLAMLEEGKSGWVSLKFEIDKLGNVENPVLFEASPPGVFELAAIHAIKKFKYKPKIRVIDNTTTPHVVERLRNFGEWTFVFAPLTKSIYVDLRPPTFPVSAFEKGFTEGTVVVQVDWKKTGRETLISNNNWPAWEYAPVGSTLVYAEPKNVFEESVTAALEHLRYYFRHQLYYPPDDQPRLPVAHDTREPRLFRAEFSLDSKPRNRTVPKYPQNAIQNEIEGNVVVQFDISKNGTVERPKVVHSDAPGILDGAAIEHVKQFTYDSRDEISTKVLHLVAFELNKEPKLLSNPGILVKSGRASLEVSISDMLEWYINIQFDINEAGSVENATIRDSNAPSNQQQRALRHTKNAKFQPKIVNGVPVPVLNMEHQYVISPEAINSIDEISEVLALGGSFPPIYQIHADENAQVVVQYDVDRRGRVITPAIVSSTPEGVYHDRTLEIAKSFRYDPLNVAGNRIGVDNIRHSLVYRKGLEPNTAYRLHLDDGSARFNIGSAP